MRRHLHRRNVIGTLAALVIAGLALYVGGGWGIVIVEGTGALLVAVLLLQPEPRRERRCCGLSNCYSWR